MEIPPDALDPITLRNLVEEFVTREGTDYGQEFSLLIKVEQVLAHLRQGRAAILFDSSSGSCHIVSRNNGHLPS